MDSISTIPCDILSMTHTLYGLFHPRVLFLYFGHIPFVGLLYTFGSLFLDVFLGFPFGRFPFGSRGDLLDIRDFGGYHVYCRLFLIGCYSALLSSNNSSTSFSYCLTPFFPCFGVGLQKLSACCHPSFVVPVVPRRCL